MKQNCKQKRNKFLANFQQKSEKTNQANGIKINRV